MGRLLSINRSSSGSIAQAVAALHAGDLVIFPTETFYGIAADPESSVALEQIFALKGRERGKPIALIAPDTASAFALAAAVPALAHRLAAAFWPGPLTIILPARPGLHEALVGPGGVGVRVSPHPMAQALAAGFGRPLTATSANLSGAPPIADPRMLERPLRDRIKVILEDGVLAGGAPSTIVEVANEGLRLIRPGAIDEAALREAIA